MGIMFDNESYKKLIKYDKKIIYKNTWLSDE